MQHVLNHIAEPSPFDHLSGARNPMVATQALTLSTRAYAAYLPGLSAHARTICFFGRGNTRTRRQA